MNDILPGKEWTKNIRQNNPEMYCEAYQRGKIIELTKLPCVKTHVRINYRTKKLVKLINPNIHKNGFDYSENFDGFQLVSNKNIYINMKCIIGKGGHQTRSLREVYWFIQGQFEILKIHPKTKTLFFANILDGDECFHVLDKYVYLSELSEYKFLKNRIYIGDLKGYFKWLEII